MENLTVYASAVFFAGGLFLYTAIGCSPAGETRAKTALDVAEDACRYSLAMTPSDLPAGKTVAELCATEAGVKPFVEHLLAAHADAVKLLGGGHAASDAGVDAH